MRTNTSAFSFAILFFLSCILPTHVFAQVGSLDLSFSANGIETTPIGTADDFGQATVIQSDGKIVVAGYSRIGSIDVFSLVRYNTDGSLDNSFDLDGKTTTQIGVTGRAHATAIQTDGKIVVAGYASNTGTGFDFALARYNQNGSLDNTFDTDGMVTTDFGDNKNEKAYSITFQADGKIIVAGYNSDIANNQRDFALVRYNTNGKIDSTFDGDGKAFISLASGNDEGRSLAIQSDGKIVLAGYSFNFNKRVFGLVRYKTNGSLDSTFDSDGIVTTPIGPTDDAAYAMVIQSDGKLVLAGYTASTSAGYDFALARYNSNGSLDNSFDGDGIATTDIGLGSNLPYTIALQNDGKILVAGNKGSDFAIGRYNANGSLDASFDTDGIVTTHIGTSNSDDVIRSMVLQSDGKIVVAGESNNGNDYDFAVARYNNTGTTEADLFINSAGNAIYPNPVKDQLNLRFPQGTTEIQITDILNREILNEKISFEESEKVLETRNWKTGYYLVRCLTAKGWMVKKVWKD